MAANQQHIIHRQIVDLTLAREQDARERQERVSRLCREELDRGLQALFDRLAPADLTLEIPRLEIDLGALEAGHWERDFLERCLLAVEAALIKQREKASRTDRPVVLDDKITQSRLVTEDQRIITAFFQFLATGHLPVASPSLGRLELERSVLASLEKGDRAIAEYWQAWIRRYPKALLRLARQFSAAFIADWLEQMQQLPRTIFQQLQTTYEAISRQPLYRQRPVPAFSEVVLKHLTGPDAASPTKLLERCMTDWQTRLRPASPLGSTTTEEQVKMTREEFTAPGPAAGDEPATKPGAEGWFVNNGGLVILAPFLPTFFKRLDLTDGRAFLTPEAQERATQLTQFLITGQDDHPEYDLLLNKLICGRPLNEPLHRGTELSAKEIQEAEDLLHSVIQHWGRIGQSSIAALRETFLQRRAKLSYRPGYRDWLLQVESKSGIDLLVSRIPWTFSMIKLPWMEEKLWVEWT